MDVRPTDVRSGSILVALLLGSSLLLFGLADLSPEAQAQSGLSVTVAPQTITSGQTATLTAVVSGASGTSMFQWYDNIGCSGTPVQSGSSDTFTTPQLTSTTSYCVVVISGGGTASAPVTVTVSPETSSGSSSIPSGTQGFFLSCPDDVTAQNPSSQSLQCQTLKGPYGTALWIAPTYPGNFSVGSGATANIDAFGSGNVSLSVTLKDNSTGKTLASGSSTTPFRLSGTSCGNASVLSFPIQTDKGNNVTFGDGIDLTIGANFTAPTGQMTTCTGGDKPSDILVTAEILVSMVTHGGSGMSDECWEELVAAVVIIIIGAILVTAFWWKPRRDQKKKEAGPGSGITLSDDGFPPAGGGPGSGAVEGTPAPPPPAQATDSGIIVSDAELPATSGGDPCAKAVADLQAAIDEYNSADDALDAALATGQGETPLVQGLRGQVNAAGVKRGNAIDAYQLCRQGYFSGVDAPPPVPTGPQSPRDAALPLTSGKTSSASGAVRSATTDGGTSADPCAGFRKDYETARDEAERLGALFDSAMPTATSTPSMVDRDRLNRLGNDYGEAVIKKEKAFKLYNDCLHPPRSGG